MNLIFIDNSYCYFFTYYIDILIYLTIDIFKYFVIFRFVALSNNVYIELLFKDFFLNKIFVGMYSISCFDYFTKR